MNGKTKFRIGMVLLIIGLLLSHFLLARSAYIAGGRVACHNTNDNILVVGFKCKPRSKPINIGQFEELNISIDLR